MSIRVTQYSAVSGLVMPNRAFGRYRLRRKDATVVGTSKPGSVSTRTKLAAAAGAVQLEHGDAVEPVLHHIQGPSLDQ